MMVTSPRMPKPTKCAEEDIYNAIKQKAKYITKQTPDITKDKLRDELKKFLEEN